MKLYFISIFPEIFQSFLDASLIKKAQEKWILDFEIVNPRDFCEDKHRQVDDEIYWGGAGMLIMAQPMIDAVNSVIEKIEYKINKSNFQIIFPSPSKDIWDQKNSYSFSKQENLIFVCGRYEWIDYRFEQYFKKKYPDNFHKISLWKFITLWGELPTMTMIESIVRLIPWVIKEENSWKNESYNIQEDMGNIEHPQYTRPQEVEWLSVPEVLLNGNHKEIEDWKNKNSKIF